MIQVEIKIIYNEYNEYIMSIKYIYTAICKFMMFYYQLEYVPRAQGALREIQREQILIAAKTKDKTEI